MANPYHDSQGKFCSKGEMLTEIKTLSKSGDFTAYAALRKSFDDIQKSKGLGPEKNWGREDWDDAIYDGPKVNVKTPEFSMQSYDLVKDKLGNTLDSNFVSHLLSSRYLPEEVRADVINRSSTWSAREVLERDSYDNGTLSATDYQNFIKREDVNEHLPLIAKNNRLSFEEKTSLVGETSWGVALLAMHNPKEFYANSSLTNKLREFADGDPYSASDSDGELHYDSVLGALSMSPYDEDHKKVLNSKVMNRSYPSASMGLARNHDLALENARELVSKQIENKVSTAASNASDIMKHIDIKENENSRNKVFVPRKYASFKYSDSNITEEKKVEIQAEIESLKPAAEESFVSEEASRLSFLKGQLYANDSDYSALEKAYKKLERKRKPTDDETALKWKLKDNLASASRVRYAYQVLGILDDYIAKNKTYI